MRPRQPRPPLPRRQAPPGQLPLLEGIDHRPLAPGLDLIPPAVGTKPAPTATPQAEQQEAARPTEAKPQQPTPYTPGPGDPATPLIVKEGAQPPDFKFRALNYCDPRFTLSWAGHRLDFQEQTSHAYQHSLALLALEWEWNDQEIADLIIAWRSKHRRRFQHRANYYRGILRRARNSKRALEAGTLAEAEE